MINRSAARALCAIAALLAALHLPGCTAESVFFSYRSCEPFLTPSGVEDVTFKTTDGLTLHGWFLPARDHAEGSPPGPAILRVHGNAGNISSNIGSSAVLTDAGFSVLIFDYRGFGRSDPAPRLDRNCLYADTAAALDYLLSRPDVDRDRIGVYGVSVGSAFALALAADRAEVRAVAESSGFSTWQSVSADHVPLLGPLLIPPGLDPVDSVVRLAGNQERSDCPLLIIHGEADATVPPYHAQSLARAASQHGVGVELILIPGGDHNDLLFESDQARRAIVDFFDRNLSSAKPDLRARSASARPPARYSSPCRNP